MKILSTLTLLLALAVGCLGYADYRQAQGITLLNLQMSALTQQVEAQHQALLSHKKSILGLKTSQKQSDRALVAVILFLKSEEPDSSPKTEPNTYASGN